MSWIGLHELADVFFGITQKLFYIIHYQNWLGIKYTNKAIFLIFFINHKNNWLVVPLSFFFSLSSLSKGTGFKRKNKGLLKFSFKASCFFFKFLHAVAVLGYLPKLIRGLGIVFSAHFWHDFFIKEFLF